MTSSTPNPKEPQTPPLISVADLQFRYPRGAFELRVPDLEIGSGERVAFTGPSGCGKTTLAHLIAGIHAPDDGSIRVDGESVHEFSESARRAFRIAKIGFIFQEFELLDYLRTEENIHLPFLLNSTLTLDQSARVRARELAESLGLGEKLRRLPRQLSQGEKQRVAICRALVNDPQIIIADEPTGNLDFENAAAVMDIIAGEAARRSATFLMITHDRGLLDRFDRVIDVTAL